MTPPADRCFGPPSRVQHFEPPFDEVHPGRRLGREVKVETGVAEQRAGRSSSGVEGAVPGAPAGTDAIPGVDELSPADRVGTGRLDAEHRPVGPAPSLFPPRATNDPMRSRKSSDVLGSGRPRTRDLAAENEWWSPGVPHGGARVDFRQVALSGAVGEVRMRMSCELGRCSWISALPGRGRPSRRKRLLLRGGSRFGRFTSYH